MLLMPTFLGARVQVICPFPAEVTAQLLPSTLTELLLTFGEKPLPVMVRYCPPVLPLGGETAVTVGRAVNSKYYPGLREDLRM